MLETFTLGTFTPLLGERFAVALPEVEEKVALELISAEALRPDETAFALILQGPRRLLPQATYELTHETLGTFPLFFTAVGQNDSGVRYEAIFNRSRKRAG